MLLGQHIHPAILVAIAIAVLVIIGAFALFFFRSYERLAQKALANRYIGLEIHDTPRQGDVVLSFHTYHGFVAWFTQTPHHIALPPDQARILLGRLARFNLTWGLLTAGIPVIVPLTLFNYVAQCRAIAAQEAGTVVAPVQVPVDPMTAVKDVGPRSRFHRFIGAIAGGLAVLFAIATAVFFLTGELEAGLGGVLVVLVFGALGREWFGWP